MSQTYQVQYTAYRPGSGEVISEGTIPVQAANSLMAESTVKLMFSGSEVFIRGVFG